MKFYKVTDGHWTDGYYISKETAEESADGNNKFIEKHKDKKGFENLSTDKWYVEEIKTMD